MNIYGGIESSGNTVNYGGDLILGEEATIGSNNNTPVWFISGANKRVKVNNDEPITILDQGVLGVGLKASKVILDTDPTLALEAATKQYADARGADNIFDQSLNTIDDVAFSTISTGAQTVAGDITFSGARKMVVPASGEAAFQLGYSGFPNVLNIDATNGELDLNRPVQMTNGFTASGTSATVNSSTFSVDASTATDIKGNSISTAQWGYVAGQDQALDTTSSATFSGATLTGPLQVSTDVEFTGSDGVNNLIVPTGLDDALSIRDSTEDYLIVNTTDAKVELKQDLEITGATTQIFNNAPWEIVTVSGLVYLEDNYRVNRSTNGETLIIAQDYVFDKTSRAETNINVLYTDDWRPAMGIVSEDVVSTNQFDISTWGYWVYWYRNPFNGGTYRREGREGVVEPEVNTGISWTGNMRIQYSAGIVSLSKMTTGEVVDVYDITASTSYTNWVGAGGTNLKFAGLDDSSTSSAFQCRIIGVPVMTVDNNGVTTSNLVMNNPVTNDIVIPDTLADALSIRDSAADYIVFNTTDAKVELKQDVHVDGKLSFNKPLGELYFGGENALATSCTDATSWFPVVCGSPSPGAGADYASSFETVSTPVTGGGIFEIKYTGTMTKLFHCGASFSIKQETKSDREYDFVLYKNQTTALLSSEIHLDAVTDIHYSTAMHGFVELSTNDTLGVAVKSPTAASDVVCDHLNLFAVAFPNTIYN